MFYFTRVLKIIDMLLAPHWPTRNYNGKSLERRAYVSRPVSGTRTYRFCSRSSFISVNGLLMDTTR